MLDCYNGSSNSIEEDVHGDSGVKGTILFSAKTNLTLPESLLLQFLLLGFVVFCLSNPSLRQDTSPFA